MIIISARKQAGNIIKALLDGQKIEVKEDNEFHQALVTWVEKEREAEKKIGFTRSNEWH